MWPSRCEEQQVDSRLRPKLCGICGGVAGSCDRFSWQHTPSHESCALEGVTDVQRDIIASLEHPFGGQWESTPFGLAKNSLSTRDWLTPQLLVVEWLVTHIYSNNVKLTILVSTNCTFLVGIFHSGVLLESHSSSP